MVEHEFSLYVTGRLFSCLIINNPTYLCVKLKHLIFSGGRNGLQSHVDEEEEARQESGGGKSPSLLYVNENFQISS